MRSEGSATMTAVEVDPALTDDASEDRRAWHALPLERLFHDLAAGPLGLSSAEAARRLEKFGPNVVAQARTRSTAAIVLSQLRSPLILLLLVAALISIAFGEFRDSLFVLGVVAINTVLGAVQEGRAEANTAALRRTIRTITRTVRDGAVRPIESEGLVPGDVVLLEAGDRVPADLRLLDGADLETDESSLTGESAQVHKAAAGPLPAETPLAERANMLHAGSSVQRGRCEALVVATGAGTAIGAIATAIAGAGSIPPLTRRLDRFSTVLGIVAIVLVAGVIALQVYAGSPFREAFFVGLALAVSVIPEGLPVAVTVALAVATRRMARRNVIVRQLPAVEGLGACTVVATDKTGTLTVNRLTAKRAFLPGHGAILVGGEGYRTIGEIERGDGAPIDRHVHERLAALGRSAALCNDASLDTSGEETTGTGDTVDIAFLVLAEKVSVDVVELRRSHPRLAEIPFDAGRRFAASLNRDDGAARLHVKGAAETILPLCIGVDVEAALHAAEAMAADGFRILAVATRHLDDDGEGVEPEAEMVDLELLGLVGFIDPLRPEAREAVLHCRRAGVGVKMITGDHAATALAIARDLGIADAPADVVTGRELAALGREPDGGRGRIARARVFARVEPMQKVQIVEALRGAGEIVAMTGDGVNDAPALRRADLGVAMGKGGTDVARDAADLVLTDDNFASVVAGIEEGRAAYANIRKVIYLLISTGAAEVVLFMLALATGLPVPLTAVQLLWLNLVTNGGQDVALAFERREPGLLDAPPRRPGEPIFDRLMISETVISGAYMGVVGYAVFAWALAAGLSEFEARNILLFLMVLFENVHVFNCRSETRSAFRVPLSANWPLILAVAAAQAVQIAAAFVPGLRDVLQIEPIALEMWLTLVPIALSVLLVMEIAKLWFRRATPLSRAGWPIKQP